MATFRIFWGKRATAAVIPPDVVPVPAGGDSGSDNWWRSPRRKRPSKRAVGTRPALGPDARESVHAPVKAEVNTPEKVPHLEQIKAEIAREVDELIRQQGRIDRQRRKLEQAKAAKQARATRQEARNREFARIEGVRQRLAEEALQARLREIDDEDAIILAMSI